MAEKEKRLNFNDLEKENTDC